MRGACAIAIFFAGCASVGPAPLAGEPSEWKLPPLAEAGAPKPFGPCLRQLSVSSGRRSRHYYGWARAGAYYATAASALADEPRLALRLGRAARESAPADAMLLSGHLSFAGGAFGAFVSGMVDGTGGAPFAATLSLASVGLAVELAGWILRARALADTRGAVDEFNRGAAEHGCRDRPL